jgi:hypothetical protein
VVDLQKMANTCQFDLFEDSLIRDRIVVGIRDEPKRRRLLQQKKLTPSEAIDACKASEATSHRLRVMGGAAEIDALNHSSSSVMTAIMNIAITQTTFCVEESTRFELQPSMQVLRPTARRQERQLSGLWTELP